MTNEELALITKAIEITARQGYNTCANAVVKLLYEYGKLQGNDNK